MDHLRRPLALLRSPLNQLRILGILALAGFLVFSVEALSRRLGGSQITGLTSTSSNGCSCHGTANNATTVSATSGSGSFTVESGSTTTFTVAVAHASQAAAGVGIAVKTSSTGNTDAGSLSVSSGSGLQTVNSEITHNAPKSMSSGSASFSFDWTAPTTHGTYYIQAAGNAVNNSNSTAGDVWNFMSAQPVQVAGITLTSPNGGNTYCSGSNVTVGWTSTAIANVKVELSADGGTTWSTVNASVSNPGSGAGSFTWTVPAAQAAGTQYKIRVSDAANSTRNDISNANFSIVNTPSISNQPSPATVCTGGGVTLSVTASGGGLSYQWRRNGNDIAGATSGSYTIGSAATADAGTYDVQVTNACTTVTSSTAAVVVNAAPAITLQPASQTACLGQPLTLSVTATGTGLSYQWRRNGVDINGATSATYSVSAASMADTGSYSVVITGTCPPQRTSSAARVTVQRAPAITSHPTPRIICSGESASFSVGATGDGLLYQWRRNGVAISEATNATYTIPAAATADAGTYDVVVSGACSPSVTSTGATLIVTQTPQITAQPASQSVCLGASVTLTVTVQGPATAYQWRRNGTNINGATDPTMSIDSMEASDAASYDVRVTNAGCTVTSNPARLDLAQAAAIVAGPQDVSGVVGARIELSVAASGDGLGYQWKKDGANIAGADSSTFVIAAAALADAGDYSVVVSNACNEVVSESAQVTVLAAGAGAVISFSPSTVEISSRPGVMKEMTFDALIRNAGDSVLRISALTITGPDAAEFALAGVTTPLEIAPGGSRSLTVRFTPSALGLRTASVSFESNSSATATLSLRGTGSVGTVRVPSPTLEFGIVPAGSTKDTTLRVENVGDVPVTVESASVSGSVHFTVEGPALPVTIDAGESAGLTIRFAPVDNGTVNGVLTIATNSDRPTITVALGGGSVPAGVGSGERLVESFVVSPNPTRAAVVATLRTIDATPVEVDIVDSRGMRVRSLGRFAPADEVRLAWDGRTDSGTPAGAGVYRLVARMASGVVSTPVVLLR